MVVSRLSEIFGMLTTCQAGGVMVFTLTAFSECGISIGDGISIEYSLNSTFGIFGVLHIGSHLLKHGY